MIAGFWFSARSEILIQVSRDRWVFATGIIIAGAQWIVGGKNGTC